VTLLELLGVLAISGATLVVIGGVVWLAVRLAARHDSGRSRGTRGDR
jgi:hypothetical protein